MPTAYTGMINTYLDTTTQVRCIEDLIHNVSPEDTPLVKLLGLNGINNPPITSTTYEWLKDDLAPTSTTLAEAIASTTTTTCLVAANAGKFIRAGHLIQIDSELIRVTSVATDTATITRGHGSTTPATHLNAAAVELIGFAMVEGADAPASFKMDVSTDYNYTQMDQLWNGLAAQQCA